MDIPFVDLKSQYDSIKDEIDSAIQNIIEQSAFIGGEAVEQFEDSFASLNHVSHCVSVANGTDSLYIILKMLGIGPGDEVITPANSWISSSETITQTGAKPVFIDIEPDYYTLDPEQLKHKLTKDTKAIMPVHLYGQMCDMSAILEFSNRHSLFVIEDCAQSHFSKINEKNAGTFGTAGSFSFYPGKNLGAYGDAGAIITDNEDLAQKCRMFANHGALQKHDHKFEGINSRLDGIQAAILQVKLKYIDKWTEMRIENAAYYSSLLSEVDEIEIPKIRDNTRHTFHLYVVRAADRDGLIKFLRNKNISTSIHYPKILPLQSAYEYLGHTPKDYPNAFQAQQQILSLPMYPELNKKQIKYITESIKEYYYLN